MYRGRGRVGDRVIELEGRRPATSLEVEPEEDRSRSDGFNHPRRPRARSRRGTPTGFGSRSDSATLGHAVYALFLIAALAVLTVGLARQLQLLRDVLLVIGASLLGGVVVLAAHPGLSWVAEPRDDADASCGNDEELPLPVVQRISVTDARALLGQPDVTFVDARSSYDYETAHIPGAISLPADDAAGILEIQSVPIPPQGQVITYCTGGACEQSEYLGILLRDRDVCEQVFVLEGGWAAWAEAEAPTVSGEVPFGDAVEDTSTAPAPADPNPTPSVSAPSEPNEEARG